MKFVSLVVLCIFISALPLAHGADTTNRPARPINNCASEPPANQPACETAYNNQLADWQKNEDVINYLSEPNNKPTIDQQGNVGTVAPPVNNCVLGSPNYTQCLADYNAKVTAHGTAQAALTTANSQMNADAGMQTVKTELLQQSNLQASEYVRLKTLTDTSATGSLQQVQKNNINAAGFYTNSATMMTQFLNYHKNKSDILNSSCATATTNFSDCEKTAAGYAASAAYADIASQATNQKNELMGNAQEACIRQNAISSIKTSCNPTDPASPVYFPAYQTPPDITWFDPFTGLCVAGAPALCSQVYTVIDGTGLITPKIYSPSARSCPGGGTGCVSQFDVQTTPQGVKYTFQNKIGKSYSFYSKDLKDEKSLVKAGLTPAQAKNLLKDVDSNQQLVAKAATSISEKFSQLADSVKSKLLPAVADDDAKKKELDQKRSPTAVEKPAVQNAVVQPVDRKPNMDGLSKSLNGDLIGVRGDNIFKMINRRYQDKDQQIWFFGQYQ